MTHMLHSSTVRFLTSTGWALFTTMIEELASSCLALVQNEELVHRAGGQMPDLSHPLPLSHMDSMLLVLPGPRTRDSIIKN